MCCSGQLEKLKSNNIGIDKRLEAIQHAGIEEHLEESVVVDGIVDNIHVELDASQALILEPVEFLIWGLSLKVKDNVHNNVTYYSSWQSQKSGHFTHIENRPSQG